MPPDPLEIMNLHTQKILAFYTYLFLPTTPGKLSKRLKACVSEVK